MGGDGDGSGDGGELVEGSEGGRELAVAEAFAVAEEVLEEGEVGSRQATVSEVSLEGCSKVFGLCGGYRIGKI